MSKRLSLTLVLTLALISIITGCTTRTVTQTSTKTLFVPLNKTATTTVTQYQTKTILQTATDLATETVVNTETQTNTTTQTVTHIVGDTFNPIMSFSGVAFMDTPVFVVSSPKWIIQYSTNSSCTLTFSLEPHLVNPLVDRKTMRTGTVYQIEMDEEYRGNAMFFTVHTSPFYLDIEWNITVIEVWE